MSMTQLTSISDLEDAITASGEQPVFLFKHSTRCPISGAAERSYQQFIKNHDDADVLFTLLDLIRHRDVSTAIAEKLRIEHQSPQVILVKNGEAVWSASHLSISEDALSAALDVHG